eukprot:GHVP01034128.1.p1 GENE.GHVP01034128.1~~GHVP01034128.1.p1  ORF type:complete len:386 (+),score=57.89 GHVP01034128.1:828-1985(+)
MKPYYLVVFMLMGNMKYLIQCESSRPKLSYSKCAPFWKAGKYLCDRHVNNLLSGFILPYPTEFFSISKEKCFFFGDSRLKFIRKVGSGGYGVVWKCELQNPSITENVVFKEINLSNRKASLLSAFREIVTSAALNALRPREEGNSPSKFNSSTKGELSDISISWLFPRTVFLEAPSDVKTPLDMLLNSEKIGYIIPTFEGNCMNLLEVLNNLFLKKKRIPSEELALLISLKLLRMIQMIHKIGVLHCDIKIENFVMGCDDTGSTIRLAGVDFGLSCYIGKDEVVFNGHNHHKGVRGPMMTETPEDETEIYGWLQHTDLLGMAVVTHTLLHGSRPKLKLEKKKHAPQDNKIYWPCCNDEIKMGCLGERSFFTFAKNELRPLRNFLL